MGFILECNGWMPLDTGDGFWQVGSIACGFYRLEASPKGSSLESFPTLSKKRSRSSFRLSWGDLDNHKLVEELAESNSLKAKMLKLLIEHL